MRNIHNFTGRGYFPRGITLGDENGALIVIDSTYANDERLLAQSTDMHLATKIRECPLL